MDDQAFVVDAGAARIVRDVGFHAAPNASGATLS